MAARRDGCPTPRHDSGSIRIVRGAIMQLNLFKQGAQLAEPPRVGKADTKRRPHILHAPRAKSFDGVIAGKVTRYSAGKAQGYDELTKKRAGAVGMYEGWREVLNEPDRQRVGLLQMAVQCTI